MMARRSAALLGVALVAGCKTQLLDLAPPKSQTAPLTLVLGLGAKNSCARRADDSVWCWGAFGHSFSTVCSDRPSRVPNTDGAAGLALGGGTACVLRADHTVGCWEGCWILDDHVPPTRVPDLDGNVQLAFSFDHGCSRVVDGSVRCWSGAVLVAPAPLGAITVAGLDGAAIDVADGGEHCAILGDGRVRCWLAPAAPTVVDGIVGARQVACMRKGCCAIVGDGTVQCWISGTPRALPGVSNAAAIAAGDYHVCARLGDGTVRCFGDNQSGQLGDGSRINREHDAQPVAGLSGVARIALGGAHSCAVLTDDTVWCWGQNDVGQVGDGTQIDRPLPTLIRF